MSARIAVVLCFVASVASAQVRTAIDVIAGPQVSGQVAVTGWAFDQSRPFDGIVSVTVQTQRVHPDGSLGEWSVALASVGVTRPDVAAVWGLPFTQSGFVRQLNWLGAGTWRILVSPQDTHGFFYPSITTITVAPSVTMWTDTPTAGGSVAGAFTLVGWALDIASLTPPTVTACARDVTHPERGCLPLGRAIIGVPRPDVAAAFGPQYPATGWTLQTAGLARGTYDLVVSATVGSQGMSQVLRVVVP